MTRAAGWGGGGGGWGGGGGAGHDGAGAGAVGLELLLRLEDAVAAGLDGDVVTLDRGAEGADGGLVLGDVREGVELVPAHRVLVGHLVDVGVGDRVALQEDRKSV